MTVDFAGGGPCPAYALLAWLFLLTAVGLAGAEALSSETPLQATPLSAVRLTNGFWAQRLDVNRTVTIPHVLDRLEETGHLTNFDKAAGRFEGPLQGHHAFDSDVYKGLEGALYAQHHAPRQPWADRVDSMLDRILAAQHQDGFLITCYLVDPQKPRWETMRLDHQLYNAGHFFELAVAHYRLTGETTVLNAACRFADCLEREFGVGKRYDVPGHEEVELALLKLYQATGERRYLELSRFFLDERGHAHGTKRMPFDPHSVSTEIPSFEELPPAERNRARRRARNSIRNGRMQDHKPLVEQNEAVGHAVRAGYVYAALTDLARLTEAPDYARAVERLFEDVVFHKLYLTGGVGTAQYGDEGFGDPYLLPNRTYCESCANIALVLWQHRLALLTGQAKYADVMELALYNAALSGLSLSGDAFFYQNPLESNGARRRNWIGLACCPTNLARLIPQVAGLVYAVRKGQVFVNLYAGSEASVDLGVGTAVKLKQETDYPWDGRVRLTVTPQRPLTFAVCLRIPGWAQGRPVPSDLYRFARSEVEPVTLAVNNKALPASPDADGYVRIERLWESGDVVELNLPMPPRRVYAHEQVEADRGKVALMRGPLVYCVEAADHPDADVLHLTLAPGAKLHAEPREDLLGGLTIIRSEATVDGRPLPLTAVPYHAWANREKGPMTVWVNEATAER